MEKQKKYIYIGIQILRMIFAFNIVVFHCISNSSKNIILYFICHIGIHYYMPTFFIISFYFSYRTFCSRNISKLKERLLRILIPYIIWPSLFWIKYTVISSFNTKKVTIVYKDLIYQLLIGKPILPVFWFQFCLIIWTIIFIILIFSFKKTYNYILSFILLLLLYLNYSRITRLIYKYFKNMFHASIYDLFHRYINILSGFFFGSKAILDRKYKFKLLFILFSLSCFFFVKYFRNNNLDYIANQFIINIVFISSSFIPFDLIKKKNLINCIKHITSFTGGIYYLHWEIKFRTFNNISLIKKANFFSCIIIYLICYVFCFCLFRIFNNNKLRYLFI